MPSPAGPGAYRTGAEAADTNVWVMARTALGPGELRDVGAPGERARRRALGPLPDRRSLHLDAAAALTPGTAASAFWMAATMPLNSFGS